MLILSRLDTIRPAATFALWQYIDITRKLRLHNTDLLVTGLVSSVNFDLQVLQLLLSSLPIKLCERFISVWIPYSYSTLYIGRIVFHLDKRMFGAFIDFEFYSFSRNSSTTTWLTPYLLITVSISVHISVITIGHYCRLCTPLSKGHSLHISKDYQYNNNCIDSI